MRIAEEIQLSADERSDLFYALLMKDAGCSNNSARPPDAAYSRATSR